MAIRRAKRDSNYTIMSNVGLQDARLSLKAKGLLAYMLSLPDDWIFYESEIVKHATDGKQSVRTGLKELQDNGYLMKQQARSKIGKFSKVDWVLFDEPENVDMKGFLPSTDFPSTGKPSADKPSTANRTLQSTNGTKNLSKQSTNKPSSAELRKNFEKLWGLYPKKMGSKKRAFKAYEKAIKNGTTNKEIQEGIVAYKKLIKRNGTERQYIVYGDKWFYNEQWNNDYQSEIEPNNKEENISFEEKLRRSGVDV